MDITQAVFVSSVADVKKCPPGKADFAFIGRSNVGKSSLLNMLTNRKHLAKTSGTPGKTQTINHFLANNAFFLVDLPGYGYARVSREKRAGFGQIIEDYVRYRENLYCLFVLIDVRLEPQKIDLEFIQWSGEQGVPLAIVFTKADKLTRNQLTRSVNIYKSTLLQSWEELPSIFITSSTDRLGRKELLAFIGDALAGKK